MNNNITQTEFAALLGYHRSYITQLKKSGRLVMDGNQVVVDASIERIKVTADPNRDDVKSRHSQVREDRSLLVNKNGSEKNDIVNDSGIGENYQQARAIKERYLALQAKVDYEQSIGKLVESADVLMAGADIGATLRTLVENLPDQLAPELTHISDHDQIYALLVEHVERILYEVSERISQLDNDGQGST